MFVSKTTLPLTTKVQMRYAAKTIRAARALGLKMRLRYRGPRHGNYRDTLAADAVAVAVYVYAAA